MYMWENKAVNSERCLVNII